jgi:hypothetical protein
MPAVETRSLGFRSVIVTCAKRLSIPCVSHAGACWRLSRHLVLFTTLWTWNNKVEA